jgi:hypothetical protein
MINWFKDFISVYQICNGLRKITKDGLWERRIDSDRIELRYDNISVLYTEGSSLIWIYTDKLGIKYFTGLFGAMIYKSTNMNTIIKEEKNKAQIEAAEEHNKAMKALVDALKTK